MKNKIKLCKNCNKNIFPCHKNRKYCRVCGDKRKALSIERYKKTKTNLALCVKYRLKNKDVKFLKRRKLIAEVKIDVINEILKSRGLK